MKKYIIFILNFTSFLFLFSKTSLAQGTYWCAQPESGKCMLVNTCEDGYKPSNPNKCDNLVGPDIALCSAELSEEDCIPTSAPVGWRCNSSLKVCEKGCEYGVDSGCIYTEDQEATCNTECQWGETPPDWACDETTCECKQVEPGSGVAWNICVAKCCTSIPGAGIKCKTSKGLEGINSAIGCIPIETNTELLGFLLLWSIGITSGIALLLIIYSGFLIITSSGNPRKLQGGKELLIAALTGVALLILSVYLIRIIGWDILKLPGFPNG